MMQSEPSPQKTTLPPLSFISSTIKTSGVNGERVADSSRQLLRQTLTSRLMKIRAPAEYDEQISAANESFIAHKVTRTTRL